MSYPPVHKIIEHDVARFISGDTEIDQFNRRIKAIIENQSQHLPTQIAFSNLMNKFVNSSLDLLNHVDARDFVKCKLAGLIIFDCLLDVNDEIMPERRIEITNHIFKVLENDKQPIAVNDIILKIASSSVGHFARVASTSEAEFLQNFYFPSAVKLIGNMKSESHRYAGALVFTQLAQNCPALIFSKRKTLFGLLWDVVNDKNATVRTAGALSLEASLHVISQREGLLDYLKSAFRQVDIGFNSNLTEKVIGSLIILDTIINGSIINVNELHNLLKQMNTPMQEVIWKVLQRKDFRDGEVRTKVLEIIPDLANCFSTCFLQPNTFTNPNNFLQFTLKHIIASIEGKKERRMAYIALGKLFANLSNYFRTLTNVQDIFQVICIGLKDSIFCVEALTCLGMIITVSTHVRKFINQELVDLIFRGGLSSQLTDTLTIILRYVPIVRTHALSQLRRQICLVLGQEPVQIDQFPWRATSSLQVATGLGTNNGSGRSNSITGSNATSGNGSTTVTSAKEHHRIRSLFGGSSNGSTGGSNGVNPINTNNSANSTAGGNPSATTTTVPPSPRHSITTSQLFTKSTPNALTSNASSSSLLASDIYDLPNDSNPLIYALQMLAYPEFFHRYFREKPISASEAAECDFGNSSSAANNNNNNNNSSYTINYNYHSSSTSVLTASTITTLTINTTGSDTNHVNNATKELLFLLRDYVIQFLMDIRLEIRSNAVKACTTILDTVAFALDHQTCNTYAIAESVLDRLLILGVGDDASEVRLLVFKSISPLLDYLVAQSSRLHCVVEGIMDDSLPVRAASMTLLSRISRYNPLHIGPVIHLTLKQLIASICTTADHVVKQENVIILEAIVRGSDSLIIPFINQVIGPLLTLLKDPSPEVVCAVLSTVGELAQASPVSVCNHLDELAPRLIEALRDPSSTIKQETAVVAMGKLVSSFAMVTEEPYKKYEGLFDGLVRAVQSVEESSTELRLQAIRTLGLLGAVDPVVYQQHLVLSNRLRNEFNSSWSMMIENNDEGNNNNVTTLRRQVVAPDGELLRPSQNEKKLSSIEDHYFSVVIRELMNILRDSSLSYHHLNAAGTAMKTIKALGSQAACQLHEVMDAILFRLYQSESGNNIKDALLDHLITLTHLMGNAMLPYQDALTKVIMNFFDTHTQLSLDLFEALSTCISFPDFEFGILSIILPFILKAMEGEIAVNEQLNSENMMMVGDEKECETGGGLTGNSTTNNTMYIKSGNPSTATIPGARSSVAPSTYSNKSVAAAVAAAAVAQKTSKILQKVVNMRRIFRSYLRELITVLLKLLENVFSPVEIRKMTLSTIMFILEDPNVIEESASRVIHSCLTLLGQSNDISLVSTVITSLTAFACRLTTAYLPYVVPVHRRLKALTTTLRENAQIKSRLEDYDLVLGRLLAKRQTPKQPNEVSDILVRVDERVASRGASARMATEGNFQIAVQSLETAWALADRSSAANLTEWMRRLTIELIRQSPSQIIRSCSLLAKTHRPLAEELFYSSFHSVWQELFASQVNDIVTDIPLINNLEMALQSSQIPKNIMISLLNLAEFMDIQDKPLPLNICVLARQAQAANMFAKCLRYRELEFRSPNVLPSLECVDALITVCNQVGLPDRAIGILRYLKKSYPFIEIQPQWLEKLRRWGDAYYAYEMNIQHVLEEAKGSGAWSARGGIKSSSTNSISANGSAEMSVLVKNEKWLSSELGRMRCLRALGEYEDLEIAAKFMRNQLKLLDLSSDFTATTTAATTTSHLHLNQAIHSPNHDRLNLSNPLQNPTLLIEEIQRLGAHASWMLGKWDGMEAFLDINSMISASTSTNALPHHHILHHHTVHNGHSSTKDIYLGNNLSFYHAVLAIHHNDYGKATMIIQDTRSSLASNISSLLSENYSRAYRAMLTMQMLSEMEEVIDYKKLLEKLTVANNENGGSGVNSNPTNNTSSSSELTINLNPTTEANNSLLITEIATKKRNLIQRWRGRLKWAPKDIDVYRQILMIHGLVTEPLEDLDSWLELVALCRKEGMFKLSSSILRKLGAPLNAHGSGKLPVLAQPSSSLTSLNSGESTQPNPVTNNPTEDPADEAISPAANTTAPPTKVNDRVLLSTYQYWWSSGEKEKALKHITNFLRRNTSFPDIHSTSPAPQTMSSSGSASGNNGTNNAGTMFRVKCLLKKATWMRELEKGDINEILATLLEARELAKDDYWVWHAWASANYDQLKKADANDSKPSFDGDLNSTIPSVPVFFSPPLVHSNSNNSSSSSSSSNSTGTTAVTPTSGHKPLPFTGKLNYNTPKKFTGVAGAASLLNLMSMQQTDKITPYITEAIKGYARSIVLGHGQPVANLLQDTLRLITLWFSYGTKKGVLHVLETELDKVPADNWLTVIPQLIARIHLKSHEISQLLRKLLCKVAHAHPQALVWPISVALNTADPQQRTVATEVLTEMRKHRKQLVEEATLVSRELMKVAITPHELWYDGLEQAAQCYMDNQDIAGMMSVLRELHDTLNDPNDPKNANNGVTVTTPTIATTGNGYGISEGFGKIGNVSLRDSSFRQMYTKPLNDAYFWLENFRNSGRTMELHQAWELYQTIFKKIKSQIVALKRLELQHVSPALTTAKGLSLAVPGTYKPSGQDICITSFSPSVQVISSKQRPRRIALHGSDGKEYPYLLKGHEDLRQDERVMQLFGLINVCLQNDRMTNDRDLNIIRYSVLPLSNNSGLIGWVEHCDTMNQLVKQYRETRDIRLLLELKLLSTKAKNYDRLPLIHKVNLFQDVLSETTGQDLAKIMWLNSKTSDVWIERRANFTRSIAVMSMVGYILGLGDRHPSNLMVHRMSGQVVHIDFGDCFEITAHRSKYPEIIPFRLTRMITNVMDVAGMEGSYRLTCERVVRVLRENRDSVMAMLEAFVYDPLISWRLLAKEMTSEMTNSHDPEEGLEKHTSPVDKLNSTLLNTSPTNLDHDLGELGPGELSPKRTPAPPAVSLRDIGTVRRSKSQEATGGSTGAGGSGTTEDEPLQENLNARALEVINRIQAKLTGRDFLKETDDEADNFTIEQQVDRLIMEATNIENLCQLFSGWCPLW